MTLPFQSGLRLTASTRMPAASAESSSACANTDPQRDSIFTKGPADVLNYATSEIAIGTKLGIEATRKLAGEGHKRGWPPLIRTEENAKLRIRRAFGD